MKFFFQSRELVKQLADKSWQFVFKNKTREATMEIFYDAGSDISKRDRSLL